MKSLAIAAVMAVSSAASAQVVTPIPQADAYVPVPGGRLAADNRHVYRIVFEAVHGADKPDRVAPAVAMAGAELNTLAAHKVKRANMRFVLVFHTQAADEAVLDNAAYRARYGVDNPNLPVLAALKRQGVELLVCGQELHADGVPLEAVARDVNIADDGLVAIATYEGQGYAHLAF